MKHALLVGAALILTATTARADSLFPGSSTAAKTNAASVSLFSDTKARHVGDTLTVVISEIATAKSQAATKSSKGFGLNAGPGIGPILRYFPAVGLSGTGTSDASGATNRTDTLTASIAVRVMSVLPNGDLEVQGKRSVGINAETQEITLTGIVRPQDIAANNTIQSPQISNAQIKYNGKGPVGDGQKDGLLTRVFKFLF